MSRYPVHTLESAPAKSQAALQELKAGLGFIPNVAGIMATSPVLVTAFAALFQAVHSGSFTEAEIQVLLLTNAVTNRSAWPVALHSKLALAAGVAADDVSAIRAGRAPRAARHAALSELARALIEQRGHVDEALLTRIQSANVTPELVLEAILVVAASAITNYTATIGQPALEPALEPHAWDG